MIQTLAFYLFATIVVASAALTITSRNPVHSVLWLILAFFNAAGLMVLAGAEFIAMLLVIVYVGAVAVLLAVELVIGAYAWTAGRIDLARRVAPVDVAVPNIEAIGRLLYTRYLYVFEGVGLVLLVAMIGAIVLTQRVRVDSRRQNINRQINRRARDATRNVNQPVGQGVEL